MNAAADTIESPQSAARRLAADPIRRGYRPEALHEYQLADGSPWCWRIRCKHPATGEKWIRPMHRTASGFTLGEPTPPPEGKPPYHLPELVAAPFNTVVLIVEGEKCADALAKLGMLATTSGSADSAEAADWTPLRGRSVTVWPDHDAAGQRYGETVAAKLRTLGAQVNVIDATALGLRDKGDAVDWLAMHANATAADVVALPKLAKVAHVDAEEPEPLRRPLPAAAPYPVEALGPILAPAAHALLRVVQAPDAVIGASLLAAASLAAQPHADLTIDGRVSPLSLWHVTIAESGERKSAVDGWALREHREAERAGVERHKGEQLAHAVEARAFEVAAKAAEKGSDPDVIASKLRGLGASPDAPLLPYLLATDPTVEGLHKLLANGRGSVGLFSDDGGEFIGGHAMGREHKTRTAAALSKLWDRGEFDRIRSGDGASKHYGKRLALHLLVQPVIAESVLSDDTLTRQGFLARCLLAWPPTRAGSRAYVAADPSTDPALLTYWRRMRELLDRPPPLRPETRNELQPRLIGLDRDAKALHVEIANAIESRIAPDAELAGVRAWASKGTEQVLRVAAVLTLVEHPDANVIDAATIERAGEIVAYHLGEAARIVGTASVPVEILHAEAIVRWCRDNGRDVVSSRDLLRLGPGQIRTADAVNAAMVTLERHRWACRVVHPKRIEWRIAGGDDAPR